MKKPCFLLLLICFQACLLAQNQFKFDYTIQSEAFGDERKISIYLPPSYYDYPDDNYTVTYVLDGQFDPLVDMGVKILEYNTYMYKYTPTIVVGIHAKARGWEFSMPVAGDEYDEEYEGGRATELQDHLGEEVFPFIDSLGLRIKPFRTLIGHSSGGKFVLHTLFSDKKDLFDAYIGISPALRPGEQTIIANAAKRLAAGERFHKFLYCSSGTVGEREVLFGGAVKSLDSLFQLYPQHGLIWKKSEFEGMGHWTCVPPSFNTAMVELTRAFRVDEYTAYEFAKNEKADMQSQIDAFYKRLTIYNFSEIPTAGYIHQMALDLYYHQDKKEAAIELYSWGIEEHPDNYTIRKGKGKLLQKMGRLEEAHQLFQEAKLNLMGVKDKFNGEEFQQQVDYINQKLEETKTD